VGLGACFLLAWRTARLDPVEVFRICPNLSNLALTVLGIPIPSNDPPFLFVLAVHVLAGISAVIFGATAMLSPKRFGRHPWSGRIYYWSLAVVFVSMTILSMMRWAEDWYLFVLGFLSFVAATLGLFARRRLIAHWVIVHIVGMGNSYILLLTAFYVDNGKNLPLWRDLPVLAYWIAPSAIGMPIICWALVKYGTRANTQ